MKKKRKKKKKKKDAGNNLENKSTDLSKVERKHFQKNKYKITLNYTKTKH